MYPTVAVSGGGHEHAAPAVGLVALMHGLHIFQSLLQRGLERLGQHGDPVLRALAVSNEEFVA